MSITATISTIQPLAPLTQGGDDLMSKTGLTVAENDPHAPNTAVDTHYGDDELGSLLTKDL